MPPAKRDPHNSLTVLEEREKRARFSGVSCPRSIWLNLDLYLSSSFLMQPSTMYKRSFLSHALVPQGLSSEHTCHTFLPDHRCQESPQNVSSLSLDGEERGREIGGSACSHACPVCWLCPAEVGSWLYALSRRLHLLLRREPP